MSQIIPIERIEQTILQIRGQKVIVDSDLAKIYGTTTKKLNQSVRRNIERFPEDFMFQLSIEEKIDVVTICDHLKNLKYSPHLPFVFTEHGSLKAASVLKTDKAVKVSVYVVRSFVKLREIAGTQNLLAKKVNEIEKRVGSHDKAIVKIIQTIKSLIEPTPLKKTKQIGF